MTTIATITRAAGLALLLMLTAPAFAFTDADYCRAEANAERASCHAEHMARLAECSSDYAWDRWSEMPTALVDVTTCRTEAAEACADCKRDVQPCSEVE